MSISNVTWLDREVSALQGHWIGDVLQAEEEWVGLARASRRPEGEERGWPVLPRKKEESESHQHSFSRSPPTPHPLRIPQAPGYNARKPNRPPANRVTSYTGVALSFIGVKEQRGKGAQPSFALLSSRAESYRKKSSTFLLENKLIQKRRLHRIGSREGRRRQGVSWPWSILLQIFELTVKHTRALQTLYILLCDLQRTEGKLIETQ